MRRGWFAVVFIIGACGDDATPGRDAGGRPPDAAGRDAAGRDAGEMPGSDGGSDGGTDAGPPPCVPISERRVSDAAGASGKPVVAWNGDGYGVVFSDDRGGAREVYLAIVDADGMKIGTDVQLTDEASAADLPDVVWDGTQYAITYVTETVMPATAHFARFGVDGTAVGTATALGGGAGLTSLVWDGDSYAAAYHSTRGAAAVSEIFFRPISAAGAPGTEIMITMGSGNSFIPWLGFGGTDYGMVFLNGGGLGSTAGIYFARVSAAGTEIGMEGPIEGTGDGGGARLAASGDGYLVSRGVMPAGALTKLDASGARMGADIPVERMPSDLLWDGSRYAIVYAMPAGMTGGPVRLVTYDPDDAAVSEPVVVSEDAVSGINQVSLAWNGSGYAVTWADSRDASTEAYFAVVCPP